MNVTEEDITKAKATNSAIASALASGVKHYALSGEELHTVKDILIALLRDGEVLLKDPAQ